MSIYVVHKGWYLVLNPFNSLDLKTVWKLLNLSREVLPRPPPFVVCRRKEGNTNCFLYDGGRGGATLDGGEKPAIGQRGSGPGSVRCVSLGGFIYTFDAGSGLSDGLFRCAKAVGEVMVRQQHGSMINMASIFGHVVMDRQATYASSKGAIVQLTKVLAVE
jgi:hypothetical protein